MQNDVMKFIEVKPKERREILDQISGISGYETKKKKALDELGIVERRISDTNLILSEKKGYLEEIGKDREVAMKYQGMQDELKKSRSVYYYKSLYELEDQGGGVEKRLDEISKEKEVKITELARIDEEIDNIEQTLDEITRKIVSTSGGESGQIKGEMGALKSGIEKKQEEIQFLKGEIGGLEERKRENADTQEEIRKQIKEKEESLKKLKSEINSVEKTIADKEKAREEKTKDFNNSELLELEKERKQVSESLFEGKKELTLVEKELDMSQKREQELKESIKLKTKTLEDLKGDMKDREKQFSKLGAEAERIEKLSKELEETKERLSELFQDFARTESEIKTIERMEQKMGESESLKFVNSKKDKGYIGQVRELGDAPDKYKVALDVAAGKKSNCLVVKDDKAAQFYIEGLRKQKIGRATFLPLNKIRGPESRPMKGDGIMGYAKDLIKCDKKYQKVFDFIFGNTLVVKDLEAARKVGIGRVKMVTLKGDLVEKGGSMTGGYYKKSAVSFSSTE
jgi:chromosome segregation protein